MIVPFQANQCLTSGEVGVLQTRMVSYALFYHEEEEKEEGSGQ